MEYYEVKNLRGINIKYVGPTNNRGSRIKIWETDHKGEIISRFFSYDYEIGNVEQQAFKILTQNGFNIKARCCLFDRYVFLCDNWGEDFKELKDLKQ